MTTYYSHPPHKGKPVPAKRWAYVGDGEWHALADGQAGPAPAVGRRSTTSLPISELPRDGLITYTTAKGEQVTERVGARPEGQPDAK